MFVLGRNITSDWAISKSKFCEKLDKLAGNEEIHKDERQASQDAQKEDDDRESNNTRKKITKEKDNLKKQKRRKLLKMKKQKKRARIVIRNLAFQVFVMCIMKDGSFLRRFRNRVTPTREPILPIRIIHQYCTHTFAKSYLSKWFFF